MPRTMFGAVKSLENCDPNLGMIAQEHHRARSSCNAAAVLQETSPNQLPRSQEQAHSHSSCNSPPARKENEGGLAEMKGEASQAGFVAPFRVGDKRCQEESEPQCTLGRRICGTRVQSLVQAFESMISLAEVGTQFQKIGEQKWQPKIYHMDQQLDEKASDMASSQQDDESESREDFDERDYAQSEDITSELNDDQTDEDESASCNSSPEIQIGASSKVTCLQPFRLRTQARGSKKEQEFRKKLQKMLEEDSKLRIPIAQGLPWTTDEPEVVPKPPPKEPTVPMQIKLCTQYRSVRRARFDQYIAAKLMYIEQQRQEQQRLQELAEQEEIKRLRKEMIPRAQLMPYFDRPFIPQRSTKRLTIPKEPTFHCSHDHKRAKCCMVSQVNG